MRQRLPRMDADGTKGSEGVPRHALMHEGITRTVLGAFYDVYNALGYGFLESVYRNALALELRDRGVAVESEAAIAVHYRRRAVGFYRADLLVEQRVVVELKACSAIGAPERQQLLNYLRGTGLEVGLLLHFGPRPRFVRMVRSEELHVVRSDPRRSAAPEV